MRTTWTRRSRWRRGCSARTGRATRTSSAPGFLRVTTRRLLNFLVLNNNERLSYYRPDIGFFDASGQLVGAVEVRHTHAISDEKACRYDEHDVVWVEVDAEEHLRAAEVSVLRCSYDRHGRRCDTCAEKQEEKERAQALEIRRADAEKAAEDAHLAKRLKLQSQYIPLVDQFLAFYDRTTGEKPSEQTIESFEDPDGVVPFKKHKGVHIDAVFKEDPQYVCWLVEKCETCPPKLLAKAQELLEGTCRRCFKEVDASWKTLCITCWSITHR